MTKTNIQILLDECIKQEKENSEMSLEESEFFEFFSASQILKKYDLSAEEIESGLVDGALDGGLDSMYLFLNNSLLNLDEDESISDVKEVSNESVLELVMIQTKNTYSFKEDAIIKLKTTSSNLLDISKSIADYSSRYNQSVLSIFEKFRDIYTKLITKRIKLKFSYYYVSLGLEQHPNVKQQSEELISICKCLYPSARVSFEFIGANELFNLYNLVLENTMNLKLAEIPISPCQKKNYVTLVDLNTFYNFITDSSGTLNKKLFESNVRDYQGVNSVNSCISKTLEDKSCEDFWLLNNGITILANEAILVTNKELQITNPEIVNGLQTSTEIYNYFSTNKEKLDSEERKVLVRIVVPESEASRDHIIFATNNQTNIPKAALRVTDPIHLQIEMFFKSRGLYYDRRKNYYKNQGKKSNDIVSVSFLGQCLISVLLSKANYARARPSTILTSDEMYSKLYNKNTKLEVYYKIAKLGKQVKHIISSNTKYSYTERNDLLFYVIYSVIKEKINKNKIEIGDIEKLDILSIKDDFISLVCDKVYNAFIQNGGNSQVAKSEDFNDKIINLT